jgi:hypothetical protein
VIGAAQLFPGLLGFPGSCAWLTRSGDKKDSGESAVRQKIIRLGKNGFSNGVKEDGKR